MWSPYQRARQQTLRATVDWSYALLEPIHRDLFNRLSVFVGGFTLDAPEAVAISTQLPGGEALDLLSNLVDHSLIIADPSKSCSSFVSA